MIYNLKYNNIAVCKNNSPDRLLRKIDEYLKQVSSRILDI